MLTAHLRYAPISVTGVITAPPHCTLPSSGKKKQSVEMPVSPSALLQAGCKMPDKIFSDEKILLLICRRDPAGSLVLAVRASAEHSCGFYLFALCKQLCKRRILESTFLFGYHVP